MKKKKSKKSKISMQNNELFEGREKKKKSERLGIKHSWESIQGAGFESHSGVGVTDGVGCGHYWLTRAQRQGCKQNCDQETEPGKRKPGSASRWAR